MITTIEIDIYNVDVVVVIEEDWTQTNKKFKLGLEEEDLKFYAWTIQHPEYKDKYETWLLLKPRKLDNNTILHELLHIVNFIAEQKGIDSTPSNDEALAYLQGYIGEKILTIRDKYIIKSLEASEKVLSLHLV